MNNVCRQCRQSFESDSGQVLCPSCLKALGQGYWFAGLFNNLCYPLAEPIRVELNPESRDCVVFHAKFQDRSGMAIQLNPDGTYEYTVGQ